MTSGTTTADVRAAVVVGALLFAPLATITLPYRASLVAQAVLVLVATLVLLALAIGWNAGRPWPAPPRVLLLGTALYAAAATQGAVVALVRGNGLAFTAGQVLAMGLLPVAAVGAFGFFPRLSWAGLAYGIVGAVALKGLVQVPLATMTDLGTGGGGRLLLRNALSAAGIAPIGLFLAFAVAGSRRRGVKVAAWGCAAVMVFLIAATRIRSQWLSLPLGVVAYLVLTSDLRRLWSRRRAAALATALLIVIGAFAGLVRWWTHPRPNLLEKPSRMAGDGWASAVLPAGGDAALRVRGTLACTGDGAVNVVARMARSAGDLLAPQRSTPVTVAGVAPARFSFILRPPPGATRLFLTIEERTGMRCGTLDLAVEEIRPALVAEAVNTSLGWIHRPPDPGAGAHPGAFAGDASIAFRIREMAAVLAAIRSGSWATRILGHGLGATFPLDTIGYDNQGNIVHFERPNYIHNFYLFLPFKLGVLGTLEVLAALALFVCGTARGALSHPLGSQERRYLAAAAAAWITFIAWSAAAPEILDFRLAPLWGVLAGLAAATLRKVRA